MESTLSDVVNQLLDPTGGPFTLEELSCRIHIPVTRIREHLAGHVPFWSERIVYLQFFHELRESGMAIPVVDIPERPTSQIVNEGDKVTIYIDPLMRLGRRPSLMLR